MSFRLVPKSVTLNDHEWRNGHCIISPSQRDLENRLNTYCIDNVVTRSSA